MSAGQARGQAAYPEGYAAAPQQFSTLLSPVSPVSHPSLSLQVEGVAGRAGDPRRVQVRGHRGALLAVGRRGDLVRHLAHRAACLGRVPLCPFVGPLRPCRLAAAARAHPAADFQRLASRPGTVQRPRRPDWHHFVRVSTASSLRLFVDARCRSLLRACLFVPRSQSCEAFEILGPGQHAVNRAPRIVPVPVYRTTVGVRFFKLALD